MNGTATTDPTTSRPATRWRNPYRALPRLRWIVQALYLIFLLLAGVGFYRFYVQATGGGPVTVHRPPVVEGFLPISALMGIKRLLLTGRFDELHPAGLTILLAAIVSAFLARKSFCSWVCPVGTISRAVEWAGAKTLWRRRKRETLLPGWLDRVLLAPKYLLLSFFAWIVLVRMDVAAIEGFLFAEYNRAVDAKMLLFFVDMSRMTAFVLLALALLSLVVKHTWCRFLCPYGALLGLFSWLSPQRVVRDAAACIDCRACTRACPAEIRVHAKDTVTTPECTGCLSCVCACPVESCLTVGRRGTKGWSPYIVPAVGLGTILLFWAVARLTGHWETALTVPDLAEAYRRAASLAHP